MTMEEAHMDTRVGAQSANRREEGWSQGPDRVLVGKDVLELLSSSMYVDPLTIYREYVQNAADSIDVAVSKGQLKSAKAGRVHIAIDSAARSIRIRDNGEGVPAKQFTARLTAIGASKKRGTAARGFRGVGRLAGLGYCRELIFRSRAAGDPKVSEMRWDSRQLKHLIRSDSSVTNIDDLIRECVKVRTVAMPDAPEHFYEVEMSGVIRHRNDRLLDESAVANYLSQVSPVPFSPEFKFGKTISDRIRKFTPLTEVDVRLNGSEQPLYRPHRNGISLSNDQLDEFAEIEFREIPDPDGGTAALVWLLHHSYFGAIPDNAVKGLRARVGDVQIGDSSLFEQLYPETRFNSWTVGEVHVIDSRVVPNGRRDNFEENVPFHDLLNHLTPVARDISRRCRTSSIKRKWVRQFEIHRSNFREVTGVLSQGAVSGTMRKSIVTKAKIEVNAMEKIANMDAIEESRAEMLPVISKAQKRLEKLTGETSAAAPLRRLRKDKRQIYEQMFDLIYQCSANRIAAKALVDRILERI